MSYSLIEAKFQVLDRTIKMLSKSKSLHMPRLASSEQFRELVKTQKTTSLLPTIKSVKGVVVARSHSSIDRASRSQPNTSREDRSEKKCDQSPTRPNTGRRDPHEKLTERWIDPKQKRAEQLLQDTWHEIDSAVNWTRDATCRSSSREALRSKMLSERLLDEGYEQDSMPCDEYIPDQNADNQSNKNPETFSAAAHDTLPRPKRPLTSTSSQPTKSKAYLTIRCQSASFKCSDPQPKNWFAPSAVRSTETPLRVPKAKHKNCRERPVAGIGKHIRQNQRSVKPPSIQCSEMEPAPRPIELEVTGELREKPMPTPVLVKVDDPFFYMLELRLVHPQPLTDWRFQAAFTDTSVEPSRTVILDDLTADDENCLLFESPQSAQSPPSSRYFNPFLYFHGLSRPSDLYGHVLRIIVTSLRPVTRIVINTSVQFTRFPDEAVVVPPVQSIRQHSEAVATREANLLRVQSRCSNSASSESRRMPKMPRPRQKRMLRPPHQSNNHEASTASLAMDQCSPWTSAEQEDIDNDKQSSVLDQMLTLRLDDPRSPSPTASPPQGPTVEHLSTSPRLPMVTIDKKKMQLQCLRAEIRREMSEHNIDQNCNFKYM